uniref:FAS-associated factor 2 n=1 Tax=Ciona intestinalis TaxID=7719 RepID=UPI000EF4AE2D|nr:FAS-associated factor 2 [Ciona intestinalis]|eukprot:XP_026694551.1 FAS-associated factor 2 [Ciona intestinalis]
MKVSEYNDPLRHRVVKSKAPVLARTLVLLVTAGFALVVAFSCVFYAAHAQHRMLQFQNELTNMKVSLHKRSAELESRVRRSVSRNNFVKKPIKHVVKRNANVSVSLRFVWRIFNPDPREMVTDPRGDVLTFVDEFEAKYENPPQMFRGSYGEAQAEAKKNLQFLLVYLHDPHNKDSEPFCSGTLCNNDVVEYINTNMLFWGCSIQKPEGYKVSKLIRNPTYPLVAVVCLYQNQLAIVGRVQGKVTAEVGAWATLVRLREIVDLYEPVLVSARADREALNQNQQIRAEQDEAYLLSLEKDKQKMDKKRKEKEIAENEERRKEKLKQEKELSRQAQLEMKLKCKKDICEEPSDGDDVISLLIKFPCGKRINRRFHKAVSVKVLHDYVYAQDEAPARYQIFTSFPRAPIAGCSTDEVISTQSHPLIQDAGLNRNDTVFVQNVGEDSSSDDEDR